ncbi:MAG: CvpA family protein [Oscillospiraceae bacterium]|jgi:hypothetical protein|nr:CvpA family protein [Oscillospiraceae bacterium]
MKLLIELVFIAIIIACVWGGYKKGLVMTVGSILIIVVSLFAGDLLSDTFSSMATPMLRPFVSGYMEGADGAIELALTEVSGTASEILSEEDIIGGDADKAVEIARLSYLNMGIYAATSEQMAQEAYEQYELSGRTLSYSIIEVMCAKLTYYVCFILFFAVVLILLTVLGNITNLSFKIPNMDKLNMIGGAVLGLAVAFAFCCVLAWILKFTGKLLPEEQLGSLSKYFVKMNFLSKYLSI